MKLIKFNLNKSFQIRSKNRKRLTFFFLVFCSLFFSKNNVVNAQDTSAFLVIGIEAGGLKQNLFSKSEDRNLGNGLFTVGFVMEVPFKNKFSIGTGLTYSRFGGVRTYEKTGLNRINDFNDTEYEVFNSGVQLSYLSVPIRLIYRLKCNCVYAQLGIQPTFYASNSNNYNYSNFYTTNPERYSNFSIHSLNKVNWIFDFGIGFKANFRDNLRLIIIPSYHKVLRPFFNDAEISSRDFLRIGFSFQYAFLNR